MKQYLELLEKALMSGRRRPNRTGVDTIGIFGAQMRFDLQKGFPLVTTKRVFWRGVAEELFWFIRGETNVAPLVAKGISIWTDWPLAKYRKEVEPGITKEAFEGRILSDPNFAAEWGELGPVYGKQWRAWTAPNDEASPGGHPDAYYLTGIDQLKAVVERIKTDPGCRRLIVSAWNPVDIPLMALPPCHCLFQFYVRGDELSCHLYQRSADMFLGVPFNIASYALLTHLVARHCGLEVGEFIHTLGDAHIYDNHVSQVEEQLKREPRPLPSLGFKPDAPISLFEVRFEHLNLVGYDPHPALKGEVAV